MRCYNYFMNKICTKCEKEKDISRFFIRDNASGRLHAQCKACYSEHRKSYSVAHYEKFKDEYLLRAKVRRLRLRDEFHINMLNYLQGKACAQCKESDIRVLELDHVDPTLKPFFTA